MPLPPEVTTGIAYGIPLAMAFGFFKLYTWSQNRRRDAFEDGVNEDVTEIKNELGNLNCGEISKVVAKTGEQLAQFIKYTEKNVERHDGSIKKLFECKDEFVKDIAELKAKSGNEARDSETTAFKRKNLHTECLLVEDDNAVRGAMSECIKDRLGFHVTSASSVDDAMRALDNQRFDIAILDWNLGNKNAGDFINECLRKGRLTSGINGQTKIKALIYTGDENVSVPAGYLSVEKPISNWSNMRKQTEMILDNS